MLTLSREVRHQMLPTSAGGDDEFALTRGDLVASVDAYRQANLTLAAWAPLISMLASLFVGALGSTVAGSLDWPAWTQPAFFFSGIAGMAWCLVSSVRRQRRLTARTQWQCPNCHTPLIAAFGLNPLARAEIVIASGRCPQCAQPIFGTRDTEHDGP